MCMQMPAKSDASEQPLSLSFQCLQYPLCNLSKSPLHRHACLLPAFIFDPPSRLQPLECTCVQDAGCFALCEIGNGLVCNCDWCTC